MVPHKVVAQDEEKGEVTVEVVCRGRCDGVFRLVLPDAGYHGWMSGSVNIQRAMPRVPAAERELLISGTCGSCFDEMFPPGEED